MFKILNRRLTSEVNYLSNHVRFKRRKGTYLHDEIQVPAYLSEW